MSDFGGDSVEPGPVSAPEIVAGDGGRLDVTLLDTFEDSGQVEELLARQVSADGPHGDVNEVRGLGNVGEGLGPVHHAAQEQVLAVHASLVAVLGRHLLAGITVAVARVPNSVVAHQVLLAGLEVNGQVPPLIVVVHLVLDVHVHAADGVH